jgi:hypothetical protein
MVTELALPATSETLFSMFLISAQIPAASGRIIGDVACVLVWAGVHNFSQ